jgi:hypothetical protein
MKAASVSVTTSDDRARTTSGKVRASELPLVGAAPSQVTPEFAAPQPALAVTSAGLVNPGAKSSREGNSRPVTVTARALGLVIRTVTSPVPPGNSVADDTGPEADTETPAVRVGSEVPPIVTRMENPTWAAA